MTKPLLSIIIPVYNGEKHIEQCYNSITAAFCGIFEYEIIFLEGQSSDGSRLEIDSLDAYGDVKIFCDQPKGIFEKFNYGIKQAKGEWVYLMGVDDRMAPNIGYQVLEMLKRKVHIVYGDIFAVHLPDRVRRGKATKLRIMRGDFSMCSMFIRKETFDIVGYFNPSYTICADQDWNTRAFFNKKIKTEYHPLTIATVADGGLSTTGKRDVLFERNFGKLTSKCIKTVSGGFLYKVYLRFRLAIKVVYRQFTFDAQLHNDGLTRDAMYRIRYNKSE